MKNEETAHKAHGSKHLPKLLTGATNDKYAVVMDNGRTIIYISDRSKENETRLKYEMRFKHVDVK